MIRSDIFRARRIVNKAYAVAKALVVAEEIKTVYYRLERLLHSIPKAVNVDRRPGVKTLKRKLDDIYSKFIRLKNADSDGIVRCYTCDARTHWTNITNGHFIKRQFTRLRFDDKNCHPQCVNCNKNLQGNDAEYERRLTAEYGENVVLWLKANAKMKKWLRFELETLLAGYTAQVLTLAKEKRCDPGL
jgi:hypothetical protein